MSDPFFVGSSAFINPVVCIFELNGRWRSEWK